IINHLPSLRFDGIDDYMSLPFVLDPGKGNFTIFLVAKFDNITATQSAVLSQQDGSISGMTGRTYLRIVPSRVISTIIGGSTFSGPTASFDAEIYQIRYQNGMLHLHINADEVNSSVAATTSSNNGNYVLGANKSFI